MFYLIYATLLYLIALGIPVEVIVFFFFTARIRSYGTSFKEAFKNSPLIWKLSFFFLLFTSLYDIFLIPDILWVSLVFWTFLIIMS